MSDEFSWPGSFSGAIVGVVLFYFVLDEILASIGFIGPAAPILCALIGGVIGGMSGMQRRGGGGFWFFGGGGGGDDGDSSGCGGCGDSSGCGGCGGD